MSTRHIFAGLALGVALVTTGCCSSHRRCTQPGVVSSAPIGGAPCCNGPGAVPGTPGIPPPPAPVNPVVPPGGPFGPASNGALR
jgi:hypothetical protein